MQIVGAREKGFELKILRKKIFISHLDKQLGSPR